MDKKYKHPWLPCPHGWLLVLLSIWLLFINHGWTGILFLWTYKIIYCIVSPVSWSKRKERRLHETEKAIKDGNPCVFSDPREVIEDYGIEKGNELLELARKNNNNSYSAREKTLKDFKARYIENVYLSDCEVWNDAWYKIISIPWVKVNSHKDIERLLRCPDPVMLKPQNWKDVISGIRKAELSEKEKAIIKDENYLNLRKGGLDVQKLPQELITEYKQLAYKLIPWGMSYEEKEMKMKTFKRFVDTWGEKIEILGLREEDLR